MPRAAPGSDAKIGKKIDFIAAELGAALAPLGYTRKSRTLWRESGLGQERCFQVLDLQGDKWNEGSEGKFCMNIGVQFPELIRIVAELLGEEWRLAYVSKPDTAATAIRGRLQTVLPAQRESWWTAEMDSGRDIWFNITAKTDLLALSTAVTKAAQDYVVPWQDRNGSFDGLATSDQFGEHFLLQIVANVLRGRADAARAMFLTLAVQRLPESALARVKAWMMEQGIDVDAAIRYESHAVACSGNATPG